MRQFFLFAIVGIVVSACGSSEKASDSKSKVPESEVPEPEKAQGDSEQFERYTPEWYINRYKGFAITEMKKSGVPASITLAQGMLESSYGKSKLAKEGKNHFGIKCHKDEWNGGEMYLADDRPNECFRTYESVLQSYHDHSRFLKDGYRYQDLFDLDPMAYKKWAKGLKDAGYATNPRYDYLLINLIEKHNLHYYDKFHNQPYTPADDPNKPDENPTVVDKDSKQNKTFEKNGLEAFRVNQASDLASIADQVSATHKELARFNELEMNASVEKGQIIYLEPKKVRPAKSYHVVEKGETLWEIAQQYGIKIKKLRKRNRLKTGEEPAVGSRIFLRERRYTKVNIRQKPVADSKKERKKAKTRSVEVNDKLDNGKNQKKDKEFHTVRRGETMQNIAQQYGMSVALLYKKNRMDDGDQPAVGAKIHLKERRYVKPELKEKPQESSNQVNNQESNEEPDESDNPPQARKNSSESNNQKKSTQKNKATQGPKQDQANKKEPEQKANNQKNADQNEGGETYNQSDNKVYHTVKPEETLYSIAKKYGVGVSQLKDWNDLKTNSIEMGQELRVQSPELDENKASGNKKEQDSKSAEESDKPDRPTFHEVKDGETLYRISVKYNMPVSRLKKLNGLSDNQVEKGERIRLKPEESGQKQDSGEQEQAERDFHKVEQGETLFSIAKAYDISVKELKRINGLENNDIDTGQKLYLEPGE